MQETHDYQNDYVRKHVSKERQESFDKLLTNSTGLLYKYPFATVDKFHPMTFNPVYIDAAQFIHMKEILRLVLEYQQEYPNLICSNECTCNHKPKKIDDRTCNFHL